MKPSGAGGAVVGSGAGVTVVDETRNAAGWGGELGVGAGTLGAHVGSVAEDTAGDIALHAGIGGSGESVVDSTTACSTGCHDEPTLALIAYVSITAVVTEIDIARIADPIVGGEAGVTAHAGTTRIGN